MKDQKTKEKFVELRAEGLSFDKIAQRINVSKPTLLNWNKELNSRIEELKSIRYEEILEKFKATKEKRIGRLSKELEQAWAAYEEKDYRDLTKRELLLMIIRLERRLIEETDNIKTDKQKEEEPGPLKVRVIRKLTDSKDTSSADPKGREGHQNDNI